MKKAIPFVLIILIIISCDPVSLMDANITNSTAQNISITFVSSADEKETYQLNSNQTILFQEGSSNSGGFLEPSLAQYDSVYIQNDSNEILKVFKEDTAGKNIYNVNDFWILDIPSKLVYNYDYQITSEDLQ